MGTRCALLSVYTKRRVSEVSHHARCYRKPLLLLYITLAVHSFLQAQPIESWTDDYIDQLAASWPANVIDNVPKWLRWSPKGGTRMTIVQIGDSHVQGDVAAVATRTYLTRAFKLSGGAIGFSFPFGMARSNDPRAIRSHSQSGWTPVMATKTKVEQPFGIAGAAIDAYSKPTPMHVGLRRDSPYSLPPSEVQVLFVPSQKAPALRLNGVFPDTIDKDKGTARFSFATPPQSLTLSLDHVEGGLNTFRFLGFVLDNQASPLVFHAAGINGADVRTHLRNTMLPFELAVLNPQIIILSLGTNDAFNTQFDPVSFRADYTQLIRRIRFMCPKAFIVLATPNDHLYRNREPNTRVADAAETICNLAADEGCGVWDFYRIMGGEGSIYSWDSHGLTAADRLHFSPLGYRLQGTLLGVALYRMLTQEPK